MRKGFTLVEMVVVIVIIGILGSIAVPVFMAGASKSQGRKGKGSFDAYCSGREDARSRQ